MAKKTKDEFQELLDEELKDPKVAAAFHDEKEVLRLAIKIHRLRKEHGLTQEELAERVGTTQSVIARLENDSYTGHSLKMLRRVAHALDATLVIDFEPIQDSR